MHDPIAALPDTPFTWSQARALGVRRRALDAAVREHRLIRLFLGVFVRAEVEVTILVRAQAAALVMTPHGIVCDRSAAWIWGVDTFGYGELDATPALEVSVLRGHDPSDRFGVAGGSRDLRPEDWVEVGGIRVTTPLRTALDLGCLLTRRSGLAAMDALMRRHGFTVADLRRQLPRYFRRRGVVQLRQLVPLVDPRSESPGESWTRLEILDHGLPAPQVNHWVLVGGVPTYRLDLAYPHARVAVEYDGEEYHSSDDDRERDQDRRSWLRDRGWTVIVVDRSSFTPEAIAEWIGSLRRALVAAQRRPVRFGRQRRV